MSQLFATAIGGSIGALMRFWVATSIYAWLGRGFPYGTLFVNVSGSFLMGLLTELMLQRFALSVEYRAAILIGFLGAYTTFSTFAIETLYLIEEGSFSKAGLNVVLSVMLCLTAVWSGLIIGRQLFANDLYPWLGHGFPYVRLASCLVVAFLLGVLAETVFRRMHLTLENRAMILVTLMGMMTVASTLHLFTGLAESKTDFQGLIGIFAITALGSAAAVWAGLQAGRQL